MTGRKLPILLGILNGVNNSAILRIKGPSRLLFSTISNKREASLQSNQPINAESSNVPGALSRTQYLEFQERSKGTIATRWRRQLSLWVVGNFGLLASMLFILK